MSDLNSNIGFAFDLDFAFDFDFDFDTAKFTRWRKFQQCSWSMELPYTVGSIDFRSISQSVRSFLP